MMEVCVAISNCYIVQIHRVLTLEGPKTLILMYIHIYVYMYNMFVCMYMCLYAYVSMFLCACIHQFVLERASIEVFFRIFIKEHLMPLLIDTIELYNYEKDFKVSRTSLLKYSKMIILSHYQVAQRQFNIIMDLYAH